MKLVHFVVLLVIFMGLRFIKAFISAKHNRVKINFDVKKNLLDAMETILLILSIEFVLQKHLLAGLLNIGVGMTSVTALKDWYNAKTNGQKPRPLGEFVINGIAYMILLLIAFFI